MTILSTKARVATAVAGVALAASVAGFVPAAQAAQLTPVQINAIVNLLQAFGASGSTISSVQAVLNGTAPTTVASSSTTPATTGTTPAPGPSQQGILHAGDHASSCSAIGQSLSYGSTGASVTQLQQFLAKQPSIYPQGLVTGFYGRDTEEAVQRWQASRGIVATGTPGTTGYGVVGPRTLGDLNPEIERECGDNASGASAAASSDSSSSSSTDTATASSTSTSSDSSSTSTSGDN